MMNNLKKLYYLWKLDKKFTSDGVWYLPLNRNCDGEIKVINMVEQNIFTKIPT